MLGEFKLEYTPIVHKYIYNKLINRESKSLEGVNLNEFRIDHKTMSLFLCKNMIPVKIHHTFLREMETYGLIKIVNKKYIEILKK